MNALVPGFLFPSVLCGTLVTLATLLFGLNRSLKIAGWPARNRRRAVFGGALLLAVFYAAAEIPSRLGWYHVAMGIPTIQFGILTPIAITILLFFVWQPFRRAVETVPQQWFVGLQLFRIEGLVFLLLYAAGRLPAEFALPAGFGDVAVGLLAPLVAIAYTRKWRSANTLVRVWNILGIADLIVAITTGFLTSPSPIQRLALDNPNELISQYPLAMIPVFLVPLGFLLHLASLQRLRQVESPGQTGRVLRVEPTFR